MGNSSLQNDPSVFDTDARKVVVASTLMFLMGVFQASSLSYFHSHKFASFFHFFCLEFVFLPVKMILTVS